jgi:hypothetical protein
MTYLAIDLLLEYSRYMETGSSWITCDGCRRPASPAHTAARLQRLELSTRFRPIHINVLFVALAPPMRPENFFYRPPESRDFFASLLEATGVTAPEGNTASVGEDLEGEIARVTEFQHRGFYLAYLSECPTPEVGDVNFEDAPSLSSALILRIRFNYRPRQVALLGREMRPTVETLKAAGMGEILVLDHGQPLEIPQAGDVTATAAFQAVLSGAMNVTSENHGSEYDRIRVKQT